MSAFLSFVVVFAASLIGACVIVGFYALGTRLLAVAGRALFVEPAEFTDAITVITPEEAAKAQKKADKARRKNPLGDGQKRAALALADSTIHVRSGREHYLHSRHIP